MKGNTMMLALCAGFVLNGCTAKIEGGSNPPPPPADNWFSGKIAVQGPSIEGDWTSGCVATGGYFGRERTMSFKGANFERIDKTYQDAACRELQSTSRQSGEFRFVKSHGDGSYDMETRVAIGQGAHQYFAPLLALRDAKLAVSDDGTEAGLRELPMSKKSGDLR